MSAIKEAVTDAVETMKRAEDVIDGLMRISKRLTQERSALYVAVAKLICPECEHELQHHVGKEGCEIERGDGYRHAEFEEALGPCGCNVDDLKDDYPDFVRALEAFRMAKGVQVSTATESKHAPGPWKVDADHAVIRDSREKPITQLWYAHQEDHYAANARLIAAAPAMLLELEHELEDLDAWLCDESISDDTKQSMLIREVKIQKVVRLAKGESL